MLPAMQDNKVLISRLETYFRERPEAFAAAYVFGSVSNCTAKPNSDLDIAVMPLQPITAESKMALIKDLAEISGRPIDIVDLSTANGAILKQALTTGRRLANNNNTKNAEAFSRMLAYETDLAPQIKAAEKQQVRAWMSK
jgi:predicted nucleotidyltransferase